MLTAACSRCTVGPVEGKPWVATTITGPGPLGSGRRPQTCVSRACGRPLHVASLLCNPRISGWASPTLLPLGKERAMHLVISASGDVRFMAR